MKAKYVRNVSCVRYQNPTYINTKQKEIGSFLALHTLDWKEYSEVQKRLSQVYKLTFTQLQPLNYVIVSTIYYKNIFHIIRGGRDQV